ncbi:hypothetical protein [Silvibacterium dinghuense]|uniref:Uncharacterized protein n=1 Tax=Silvibacterium dinghuense TaxID=1560006 RepID=A0A4Q1SCN2_9BACT|nr:hypothetical protein [Silvibacterium dinghuense]RXS94976.1 hypothetical protein ESZ00_10100 [Silvibacterium dinghuense]GGH09521.1 hypothetical protein GCM10011586_27550 [Silvibacterium dinghuense]
MNRVLIAEQNPSALTKGALPFVDAYYDIRHNYNNTVASFSISGYSGSLPQTIQNMPEEQIGAVYGEGDGSFALVSYASEKEASTISIPGGLSSSVFIARDKSFVYAANDTTHVVSVIDVANSKSYTLNLPNVYAVSVNPGGSIALLFVRNATQAASASTAGGTSEANFAVYSVVHLTTTQSQEAINNPNWTYTSGSVSNTAQDCEPQNLPVYCIFPVSTGANATFDNPVKALFSSDGSTVTVLNCGKECGGTTSSITTIPLTSSELNTGVTGGEGIALTATATTAIPGGVTNGLYSGNTLYLAGQEEQSDGLFAGNLTVFDTTTSSITGTYSISDGTHNRMVLGDEDTLWIGSSGCIAGERYKQVEAGSSAAYGCLTMFNTSTNAVTLDSYKGDATGIAPVTGLDKVYTAEGGQVYIYNTADMSERNNANVTVSGTAADVAYMDASSDADNTIY